MPEETNPQTQQIGLDGIIEKPLKSAFEIVDEKTKAMQPPQEKQPKEISVPIDQQAEVIHEENDVMESARHNTQNASESSTAPTPEINPEKIAAKTETHEQNAIRETIKEFQKLPPEKKKSWLEGIAGIGFTVQEMKGKFFSFAYGEIEKKLTEKGRSHAEQSTTARFVSELRKSYERTTEEAIENKKKLHIASTLGRAGRTGLSAVTLIGNATLYGRTITDIAGLTAGTSTRYVSMAAMALARGGEVAKETRLASAESIDDARIHDIDTAAKEAWKIYELAGGKSATMHETGDTIQAIKGSDISGKEISLETGAGTTISKEDLEHAYKKQLGDDLLNRLAEKPEGLMQALAQKIVKFQINRQFKKINQEFFNAKYDAADSLDQRRREELVLKKHAAFLRTADRFVGNNATIDLVAYGSGLLEKGGKALAIAMTLDTLTRGTLWLDREFWGGKINETLASALEGNEPSVEFRHDGEPTEHALKNLSENIAGGESISEKNVIDAITPDQKTSLEEIEKTMMERSISEDAQTIPEASTDEIEKMMMERSINETLPIEASASFTETVQKGDSVWKMIDRALEKEYGAGFDPAKKTFIIDAIKDRIATNPEEFGLKAGQNIDQLEIGQKINLSTTLGNREYMDQLMQKSGALSEETLQSITKNDATLNELRDAHPDAPFTTEQTEEILHGEGHVLAEMPFVAEPSESAPMETTAEPEIKQTAEASNEAIQQPAEKQTEIAEEKKSITDAEHRAEEQKIAESAEQAPITESLEEKMRIIKHIETNRSVLLELGLHERVVHALPDNLLADIKPLDMNAYEIAYRDLGIENFDNETAIQNYTVETFTILTSNNKRAMADWIREYRSVMIENANENPLITAKYIDDRVDELKKYLDISSIEKAPMPIAEAPIETESAQKHAPITEPIKTSEDVAIKNTNTLYEERLERLMKGGVSKEDIQNLTKEDIAGYSDDQIKRAIDGAEKINTSEAHRIEENIKTALQDQEKVVRIENALREQERAVAEQAKTLEGVIQTPQNLEASAAIEIARNTIRDQEIQYGKMIEKIKSGEDSLQNSILRENKDSRLWQLDVEQRIAKTISENPEKYAKYLPEENAVVFEGSIMVPGRPGSPIKELKQPFNVLIEGVSARLSKK